jgi:hypothetical protein
MMSEVDTRRAPARRAACRAAAARCAGRSSRGTVTGDPAGSLRLNEFDLTTGAYTGRRWIYQLDDPAHLMGDAITVDAHRLPVLEGDTNPPLRSGRSMKARHVAVPFGGYFPFDVRRVQHDRLVRAQHEQPFSERLQPDG